MDSPSVEKAYSGIYDFSPPATATVRLVYRAEEQVYLKSPPVHAWRGQLGEFLHRIAPQRHHRQGISLYKRLFRTPRSSIHIPGSLSDHTLGRIGLGGEFIPHPFVLRMADPPVPGRPLITKAGSNLVVEFIMLGDALDMLPALYAALESIGKSGLGSKTSQTDHVTRASHDGGCVFRGRAVLQNATIAFGQSKTSHLLYDGRIWRRLPGASDGETAASSRDASESASTLQLQFWTPVRLQHGGSLVRPDRLSVSALGSSYFRRLAGLSACYGSHPPNQKEIERLHESFLALGKATRIGASDLRWISDSRFSSRQGKRQPVGGLFGTINLEGSSRALDAWRHATEWIRLLHIGKKTSFGLGRVEMA